MTTKEPLPGPGQFQWNRGGWFGSQLGGTAWMLVGAVAMALQAPNVASVWLVCFLVANAIGFWMWWRRDRLRPYLALQSLLLVCGINGLAALVVFRVLRPDLAARPPMGADLADTPRSMLWLAAMIISLMIRFHVLERNAKKQRSRSELQTSP